MAILLVLAGHTVHKLEPVPRIVAALVNGDLGVSASFVLSGFLITSILLREYQTSGTVRLRRFYLRRAFRIFPAFYAMLAVTIILAGVTRTVSISGEQALFGGVFLVNYSPVPMGWWLGHIWTLSNEEQFYILWPSLLLLLRPRRAFRVAVAVLVAEPFVRVATYVMFPGVRDRIPVFLHTRVDSLLIGAAVALAALLYPAAHERLVAVVARYRLAAVAVGVLVVSSLGQTYIGGAYLLTAGYTVNAVAIVTVILAAQRPSLTSAVLSWRPLMLVGSLSYSLYLWQQIFLSNDWKSGPLASAPICLLLILAVALTSRFAVELPARRLRDRLEARNPLVPAVRADIQIRQPG